MIGGKKVSWSCACQLEPTIPGVLLIISQSIKQCFSACGMLTSLPYLALFSSDRNLQVITISPWDVCFSHLIFHFIASFFLLFWHSCPSVDTCYIVFLECKCRSWESTGMFQSTYYSTVPYTIRNYEKYVRVVWVSS